LKGAAIREVYKTPGRKRAFKHIYGWFR